MQEVFRKNDEMILYLDCLDEALKMFQNNGIAKESQLKTIRKLFDEWNGLKKIARDTKKEIAVFVSNETEKNQVKIRKLEEELK
jgi:hypothetical protein